MPLPAARHRRYMWLVVAFTMLLALAPVAVIAQETVTPIPAQSGVVVEGRILGTPAVLNAARNLDSGTCPEGLTVDAGDDAPFYDYVILIDVSGSMVGIDPSGNYDPDKDIWTAVRASAAQFIEQLDSNAAVYIVPFAQGVFEPVSQQLIAPEAGAEAIKPYYLSEAGAKAEVIGVINDLQAIGLETHIAQSVEYTLQLLKSLKDDDRPHVQTLLLYTDGVGNGPGDKDTNLDGTVDTNPKLPDLLRDYLADENYLFTKYIALGDAAASLSPELREKLTGVGVSIVTTETVPSVREVRLALVPNSLGILEPNGEASVRLCPVTGDVGSGLEISISDDQRKLPDEVALKFLPPEEPSPGLVVLGTDGAELGWRLVDQPEEANGQTHNVQVNVSLNTQEEIILVPGQFDVPFTIAVPTPTPEPTLVPPGASISIGDFTEQRVSLKDDPGNVVEWVAPLRFDLGPGAAPEVSLAPTTSEPALTPAAAGFFRVGGREQGESITLSDNLTDVEVVIRTTAGAMQPVGPVDDFHVNGGVIIDPMGAILSIPNVSCSQESACTLPFTTETKIYKPFDYGPIIKSVAGVVGLVVLLLVLRSLLPALPKHAALLTGRGAHTVRHELRQYQRGFPPGAVSIGSAADDVPLGMNQSIGSIKGKWGPGSNAVFEAAPNVDGVQVDGQAIAAGTRAKLDEASSIRFRNVTASYTKSKPI